MNKVNILGVYVDKLNIQEASDKIIDYLKNDERKKCVYTPNSEIIMAAYRDKDFLEILNNADILTADGIGVVYASKILSNPIKSRAAGYDIACEVLRKGASLNKSIYLFGAKPGVADIAAQKITKTYPGIQIACPAQSPVYGG